MSGSKRAAVAAFAVVLLAASVAGLVWAAITPSARARAWLTFMVPILALVLSLIVLAAQLLAWSRRPGSATTAAPAAPPATTGPSTTGETESLSVGAPLGSLPDKIRGREDLLDELRQLVPGHVWVLAGMGGVGKSTMALAAADEARHRKWRVWWVTATDTTSLTGKMLEILRQLQAPDELTELVSKGAPTAADRAWEFLNGSELAGCRWLLIFDNADNPAVLAAPGSVSPGDQLGWLRADPRGVVILTTRHTNPGTWGHRIAVRPVKPLEDGTAAQILTDLAPGVHDPDGHQAHALAHRLGGLPLALHVIGSYLGSKYSRWSTFAEFHRALDRPDPATVLDKLRRFAASPRSDIGRTWDFSLDALAEDCPQAPPLLSLLSCYAPATAVPITLLRPDLLGPLLTGRRPGDTADDGDRFDRLLAGLGGLTEVGLISAANSDLWADTKSVTVHPVVADVNRARLRRRAAHVRQVSGLAARLLHAACADRAQDSPSDWPAWQGLVPHILALLGWAADDLPRAALADLLMAASQTGMALVPGGDPGTAEDLAQAGRQAGARLGKRHPACLAVRRALAAAVAEQGRNLEAKDIYRDLIRRQKWAPGADRNQTLAARGEYVRALGFLRDPDAEKAHRKALADQQRALGQDHHVTLMTKHWLGRLLVRLGRFEEAEQVYREVLEQRIRTLGPHHPDTLVTRHTLAWAIARQKKYDVAEGLFWDVRRDQIEVLRDDCHPHVLGTGRALGWCIARLDRHAEAEELLRRVLAAQKTVRGETHPATLETMQTLAYAVGGQSRHSEAEDLYDQVLKARLEILGADSPYTLDTRHMLALCLASQDRKDEARQKLRNTLERREQVLGHQHPDTHATREALERLTGRDEDEA